MGKLLSRNDILSAPDIKTELLPVPEWGGDVLVRTLSGTERDAWEATLVEQKKGGTHFKLENVRAKLVALTLVDDDGQRIFSEADVVQLGDKSAAALSRVYNRAAEMSGVTEKDAEELAKN